MTLKVVPKAACEFWSWKLLRKSATNEIDQWRQKFMRRFPFGTVFRIILKGQCHEIFCFWFFSLSVSPQPQSIPLRSFQIFRIFPEIFASQGAPPKSTTPAANFSTSFPCVVDIDTGGKFATGVNDTGGIQYEQLSSQRCPKEIKHFWRKIFSICHRCQRHRWCTLSCEYLREFSKKFETALMV